MRGLDVPTRECLRGPTRARARRARELHRPKRRRCAYGERDARRGARAHHERVMAIVLQALNERPSASAALPHVETRGVATVTGSIRRTMTRMRSRAASTRSRALPQSLPVSRAQRCSAAGSIDAKAGAAAQPRSRLAPRRPCSARSSRCAPRPLRTLATIPPRSPSTRVTPRCSASDRSMAPPSRVRPRLHRTRSPCWPLRR